LTSGASDAASRKNVDAFYAQAIPAESIARAIRDAALSGLKGAL